MSATRSIDLRGSIRPSSPRNVRHAVSREIGRPPARCDSTKCRKGEPQTVSSRLDYRGLTNRAKNLSARGSGPPRELRTTGLIRTRCGRGNVARDCRSCSNHHRRRARGDGTRGSRARYIVPPYPQTRTGPGPVPRPHASLRPGCGDSRSHAMLRAAD